MDGVTTPARPSVCRLSGRPHCARRAAGRDETARTNL